MNRQNFVSLGLFLLSCAGAGPAAASAPAYTTQGTVSSVSYLGGTVTVNGTTYTVPRTPGNLQTLAHLKAGDQVDVITSGQSGSSTAKALAVQPHAAQPQ